MRRRATSTRCGRSSVPRPSAGRRRGRGTWGVLVAYRDLERSTWRAVAPIVRDKPQRLMVDVGPRKVTITSWILEP